MKKPGKQLSAPTRCLAALALGAVAAGAAPAPSPAPISLWRLDCGSIQVGDLNQYNDTFRYVGRKKTFADSCYLIRHKDQFLLRDTGLPSDLASTTKNEDGDQLSLRRTLKDQLTDIGVKPEQVTFLSVSHSHFDHTGQASSFPSSTLLVDRKEWDVIKARPDRASRFQPWVSGSSKVEQLTYDHDVFGDGSVTILTTPGHTPGHRSLLVRLPKQGSVLLSGDAVHFRENWTNRGVPGFNTSRAESLASMDRLAAIATQLKATIVIQHEPADISKLPAFPKAAQ